MLFSPPGIVYDFDGCNLAKRNVEMSIDAKAADELNQFPDKDGFRNKVFQ